MTQQEKELAHEIADKAATLIAQQLQSVPQEKREDIAIVIAEVLPEKVGARL